MFFISFHCSLFWALLCLLGVSWLLCGFLYNGVSFWCFSWVFIALYNGLCFALFVLLVSRDCCVASCITGASFFCFSWVFIALYFGLCFAFVGFLVSRDCCLALSHDATGLSAVCDCGIYWSYSLTILKTTARIFLLGIQAHSQLY